MKKVTDIEGVELNIGDTVYYARKTDYKANGEMVKETITKITEYGHVMMGRYMSTSPQSQLLKKI